MFFVKILILIVLNNSIANLSNDCESKRFTLLIEQGEPFYGYMRSKRFIYSPAYFNSVSVQLPCCEDIVMIYTPLAKLDTSSLVDPDL